VEAITLNYKVTDEAFAEFSQVLAIRHPALVHARRRSFANKAAPLGMICLGTATSHMPVAALVVLCLGLLWCWRSWTKFPANFAEEQLTIRKKIHFDYGTTVKTLKIAGDAITSEVSGTAKTEIYWPSIQYWVVGEKMILIGTSATQGIVIPFSEIASSEKEQLLAVLEEKLGQPTKITSP